jgi:hypothetical protein
LRKKDCCTYSLLLRNRMHSPTIKIKDLLDEPSAMKSESYQRSVGNLFFPEVLLFNFLPLRTTNWLHGDESFSRGNQMYNYSRNAQHFVEPKVSLPYSQELSTGPYPEPYQSSLYHPILNLQDPWQYYPFIYSLVSLLVSFLLVLPATTYKHSSSPHSYYMPSSSHPSWLDYFN